MSNSLIGNDLIEIKGVRVDPAAGVSNYPGGCSMRPKGGPISISADAKSFSMKGAENWTWTTRPRSRADQAWIQKALSANCSPFHQFGVLVPYLKLCLPA